MTRPANVIDIDQNVLATGHPLLLEIRSEHKDLEQRLVKLLESNQAFWQQHLQDLRDRLEQAVRSDMSEISSIENGLDSQPTCLELLKEVDDLLEEEQQEEQFNHRANGRSAGSSGGWSQRSSNPTFDPNMSCTDGRSEMMPAITNRTNRSSNRSSPSTSLPAQGGPFRDLRQGICEKHTIVDYLNETYGFGALQSMWPETIKKADVHVPLVRKLVRSSLFGSLVAVAIMFNAFCIAFDGDFTLRQSIRNYHLRGGQLPEETHHLEWIETANIFFFVFFATELVLRAASEGRHLFWGPEAHWNFFDTVLVFSSLLTLISSEGMNLTYGRMLRILRLTRALRTIRVLKYFQETRIMLTAVLNAFMPLFWSVFFVLLIMFLFGVFTTTAVADLVDKETPMPDRSMTGNMNVVTEFFPSFEMTMLSLFMAVTGGVDWWNVGRILIKDSPFYGMIFALYICLMVLGLMNIITGVFVTATSDMSKMDRETVIQNETKQRIQCVRYLKKLFEELDEEGTGDVTWSKFEKNLEHHDVLGYLSALDINVGTARALFKLLDVNESGTVSVDEFVMGCLRLKGAAKTLDVGTLMYETRCLKQLFLKEGHAINQNLRDLDEAMALQTKELHTAVRRLHKKVVVRFSESSPSKLGSDRVSI